MTSNNAYPYLTDFQALTLSILVDDAKGRMFATHLSTLLIRKLNGLSAREFDKLNTVTRELKLRAYCGHLIQMQKLGLLEREQTPYCRSYKMRHSDYYKPRGRWYPSVLGILRLLSYESHNLHLNDQHG